MEGYCDKDNFDESIEDSDRKPGELQTEHTNMSCLQSDTLPPEHDSQKVHNLQNPDVMVEIPTQELIDCVDNSFDLSTNESMLSCDPNNETTLSIDTELFMDCENFNADIQTLESNDSDRDRQVEVDKLVSFNAEEPEKSIEDAKGSEKPLLHGNINKVSQTHLEELPKSDLEHTNPTCQEAELILAENEVSEVEQHVSEDNQLSKNIGRPSIELEDREEDQSSNELQTSDQTTKDNDHQPLIEDLMPSKNIEQSSIEIYIPKDDENFNTNIQTLESNDSDRGRQVEVDKLVSFIAEEPEKSIKDAKSSEKPLLDGNITKVSQTHLEELPKSDLEHTNPTCQEAELILVENEVSEVEQHVSEDNQLSKNIGRTSIELEDREEDQSSNELQTSDQTTKDNDNQPFIEDLMPSKNIEQSSIDIYIPKDDENINTDIQTLESNDLDRDRQVEVDKVVSFNAEEPEKSIEDAKSSEQPLLDGNITKVSQTCLEELHKSDLEHTNPTCQEAELILAENEVSEVEEHVSEDNQLSKNIGQPSIELEDPEEDQSSNELQTSDQTTKDNDNQPLIEDLMPSKNDDEQFSKEKLKPTESLTKNEIQSSIDKELKSKVNKLLPTQVLPVENVDLISKPEEKPSTEPTEKLCSNTSDHLSTKEPLKTKVTSDPEKQPSTYQTDILGPKAIDQPSKDEPLMAADTSDEVPDVTDSLGLLAESSRVMEDDEEQETSEHDDGDDEEDFDPDDESSNQMTAEHSEDSSAQQSETDLPRQIVTSVQTNMPTDNAQEFIDNTPEVKTPFTEKGEFNFAISGVSEPDADVYMDIEDDIVCDEVEVTPETIGGKPPEDLDTVQAEQSDAEFAGLKVAAVTVEKGSALALQAVVPSSQPAEEDPVTPTATEGEATTADDMLRGLLTKDGAAEAIPQSPSKTKKLEISRAKNILSIVDLEESSSEDAIPTDVQELPKVDDDVSPVDVAEVSPDDVTNVNISGQIDIMSSGELISHITTKSGEIVISGVPKPPPAHKTTRLNTSELTIKTGCSTESTLVIPEAPQVIEEDKEDQPEPVISSEVFNLDSEDEDTLSANEDSVLGDSDKPSNNRCINSLCTSDASAPHYTADPSVVAYYDSGRKRKAFVCGTCAEEFAARALNLVNGIRNYTPLLELDMSRLRQELVEISDSDSEDEGDSVDSEKETIGPDTAKLLEEELAGIFNNAWKKFGIEERLQDAQDELSAGLANLEEDCKEIDAMFNECQQATDRLRSELYASFDPGATNLPSITIFDTPDNVYTCTEVTQTPTEQIRMSKRRRLASTSETPAKRPAIPLGYTSLDNLTGQSDDKKQDTSIAALDGSKAEDDKDISVVTLSAETAPPDLPPPGEITRPPLRTSLQVYAMRNAFGSWLRARLVECVPKGTAAGSSQFTMCRVRFDNKAQKSAYKVLPARCLAYSEPATVRMTIGTRVIALFKDPQNQTRREAYYSGVVSEVPNPVNSYRYLVFFDDGYAQYVRHADTRLVCEFSPLVWEEVHPFSREFVREYLMAYPERPMVRLHTGQSLKTELNGKWWICRVAQVDASLVQVHFQEDGHTEWIYRGSTRLAPLYLELQAAERQRARALPRNRLHNKVNMPYVEYTRSDEPAGAGVRAAQTSAQQEEIRRQRAVAKKSTGASHPPPAHPQAQPPPMPAHSDTVTSRVVYYTPKNAVKPHKLVPHACGPRCRRTDVLALSDLRTYNPLAKPLLSGWERQLVRCKGMKSVMYRAPCGRRVRGLRELHRYLSATRSDMPVDLFDFAPGTHCLAEFVLNKCIIAKKDLSNGKENVPVPCVNYYDNELPEFCSYNTERTPTEGVPLNLDPEFLCGCDCTDDCEDKSKCACWKMTLSGARTIGLQGTNVGYSYKRLPEPLPSGIYECNSRCKCKSTCLNRVAQHPLQLKLQVFKTLNRGWGIRALNDVPKGAFLCVYAGNLLTDATANLDGLNEGDEYLAELDYIEVVEQMKEGYEDDIPDEDKRLDKAGSNSESSEMSSSEDEERPSKNEIADGDFQPSFMPGVTVFSKRLRRREKALKDKQGAPAGQRKGDDCITISDDEEVREPSRFSAQAGMGGKAFISKYQSVRALYGEDEACYIMDAKVQGNIGRYLNHSCSPNVFVQNVFVDTHDPRFPWVAFFALWPIRAGTELTWNYNYDIGSVPSKVLYCYCGAPNCRGRLL